MDRNRQIRVDGYTDKNRKIDQEIDRNEKNRKEYSRIEQIRHRACAVASCVSFNGFKRSKGFKMFLGFEAGQTAGLNPHEKPLPMLFGSAGSLEGQD